MPNIPVKMNNRLSLITMPILNSSREVIFESEVFETVEITRLHSDDPKWHRVRKDRITASVAGDIVKRRKGMLCLLINK